MPEVDEIAPRQRGMTSVVKLIGAGQTVSHDVEGDYIHIHTAPVDDLIVRFDDGEPVPMPQGMGFRRYYKKVSFTSGTGQTIRVLLGFGSVADARATANVSVTTNVAPGNTLDNGGDVSCPTGAATLLLSADPDQLYALVSNPSTNTGTIRVGTATVGAANGIPLEPGVTLPLATTAAIYARNDTGSSITISAIRVREV